MQYRLPKFAPVKTVQQKYDIEPKGYHYISISYSIIHST